MRIVLPLILLAGLGASPALAAPAPAAVDTCFVPAERCVDRIVQAIDTAIDGHLVIGGSYNFTASAESRNVEGEFIRNWEYRRDQAQQD
jgi:hypothetical protein